MKHTKSLLIAISFFSTQTSAFGATFMDIAKAQTRLLLIKARQLPLNQKLIHGTLETDIFRFYQQQDSVYLHIYENIIKRLYPHLSSQQQLKFKLKQSVANEKNLNFPNKLVLTKANYQYGYFLLMTEKNDTIPILLASMLPCQWLYGEIYQTTTANNQYSAWLKIYQSQHYQQATVQFIDLVNELYQKASPSIQKRMLNVFKQSMQYEINFWLDAYSKNLSTYSYVDLENAINMLKPINGYEK